MDNLQNLLINKRKKLKLSLRDAAKLIGISHTYLSMLEKGNDPRTGFPINPTPETLNLISKAYNLSYEKLMIISGYIKQPKTNDNDLNQADEKDISSNAFLTKFQYKAKKRGLEFDENSIDDLLDLYEFIQKRDKKL